MKNTYVVLLSTVFMVGVVSSAIYFSDEQICKRMGESSEINPEFTHNAKVRVKDGFYKGEAGTLESVGRGYYRFDDRICFVPYFSVRLVGADGAVNHQNINQSNLELIK